MVRLINRCTAVAVIFGALTAGRVHADDKENPPLDFSVFLTIRDHFQQIVLTRADGDLTNDAIVDFKDFRQWKDSYYAFRPSAPASATVPEPATAVLLATAVLAAVAARRSSRVSR